MKGGGDRVGNVKSRLLRSWRFPWWLGRVTIREEEVVGKGVRCSRSC